jgi:hypothetical protein
MITKEDFEKAVSEAENIPCQCGHPYFRTVTAKRQVSSLMTGTGKPEIMLVGLLICDKCGQETKKSLIVT